MIHSLRYKEKLPQPRRLPSFRRLLERVHSDLFTIDREIYRYDYEYQLSDFEMLVLVLEDKRFLRHDGFDWIACFRELVKALFFQKHGGASTIDMQFVRTATGFRERTLKRKFYEIFLSVLIQFRYPKRTILRSYLRCAFFGSHLIGASKA
ncbi:MAG TPA: transglycosylase domain-containing protein, partial [Opitutaceae bacterium]